MRHFILTTIVDEFGTNKKHQRLWQDTVSAEATRHPLVKSQILLQMIFANSLLVCILKVHYGNYVLIASSLMHGVLALSALHIIHQNPGESERHLRLCDNHQSKAVETFRSVLATPLTKEMATPMFALASTISIS